MYPPAYDNMTRVRNEIRKMDRDFDLVLIMEYFDESLILLKKAFCWTFQDILYVKFNQRSYKPKMKLSEKVKQNILWWNKADAMLYDHYNRTLWKKIQNYGPSFWKDLKEFRRLNSEMLSSCVEKRQFSEKAFKLNGQILTHRLNPDVPNHDRYMCMKILRNEINYITYFSISSNPMALIRHLWRKQERKSDQHENLLRDYKLQRQTLNLQILSPAQ